MRIAIVGNGHVSREDARTIDGFDTVVRFNRTKHFGLTGRKTDILAIRNMETAAACERTPAAAMAAREIWLIEEEPPAKMFGKPSKRFTSAAPLIAAASTGLLLIAHFRHLNPGSVHIFGFGHFGWEGHEWNAERETCNRWVADGSIYRHAAPDAALTKFMWAAEWQAHRFVRNISSKLRA